MNIFLTAMYFGVALWRLSHMVVEERGFMDIFLRFRRLIGIVHDDDGKPYSHRDTNLARLFSCIWCTSMFFGIFLAIGVYLFPNVVWWLAYPFFVSAVAIYFNSRAR